MPEPKDRDKAASGAGTPPAPASSLEWEASPVLEEKVERELRHGALKCPQCGGETQPHTSDNPHKQGSYECPRCKLRVWPS